MIKIIPKWIIVYLSILFAFMMTALCYLAIRNAFFDGPQFSVAGYELGIRNSDKKAFVSWWSVPHVLENSESSECYSQIDAALDGLNYVDEHDTESGWHYAVVGNDVALIYCEPNLASG